jgi:4-amino-4-deoxy-L-arabinose transferase-like glycosyltransferase
VSSTVENGAVAKHIRFKPTRPAPRSASPILIALLLVAIFGVWVQNRTRPSVGHDDWANIDCCLSVARNFQRYGLLASRFAQNRTLYDAPPAERRYMYTSAPLRSVFVYGSLETLGDNAFSPRFTALMFAMVGAACLYAFVRRVTDRRTAALALVFFAFCPMMIYYSAKLDPQIFGMPCILLTLILYWRWSRHPERRPALVLFVLAALGALFTRRWYVFAGVLALHALAFHRWRGVWRMWPVWAGTVAGGLAWVGIGLWGMPGFAAGLADGFQRRALTDPAEPITNFWPVVGVNAVTSLTPTLLILAALGLWFIARRRGLLAHDRMLLNVLPVTLLVYNGVFWKSTYYHVFAILIGAFALAPLAAVGYLGLLHLPERPSPVWRASVGTL